MKVGEYFRNKYGIAKVIDIKNNNGIDILIFDKPICFLVNKETGKIKEDKLFNQLALIDDIDLSKIKHSSNIIDLIEVGDYVNGRKVYESRYHELYIGYVYCGGIGVRTTECYATFIDDMKEEDIYSILTKEQFESMEYKVKE